MARSSQPGRKGPARNARQSRGTAAARPVRGAAPEGSRSGGLGKRTPRARPAAPDRDIPVVPVTRRQHAVRAAAKAAAAVGAAGHSQKLQKVLAQAGLGSRREMEELIRAGKVLVNGVPAGVGTRVNPDDLVKVGRRQIRFKLSARLPRVIVYHKPEGEIVSRDDPEGRPSVFDRLPAIRSGKWLAIGRLDFNTCGLLIFTTSGELANRFSHPRFEVEREYAVRILGEVSPEQGRQLVEGISLPDGVARFEVLEAQGGDRRNRWYRVVVREGRNRLVRRMFEHVGLQVSRLMRVRFGIINLPPRLKRGQHLELTEAQTRRVLEWLATGDSVGAPAAHEEAPAVRTRRAAPGRSANKAAKEAPGRRRARR
jgi:23S rRNA pseudouridine2605 synthase